jgi:hypothetical protein
MFTTYSDDDLIVLLDALVGHTRTVYSEIEVRAQREPTFPGTIMARVDEVYRGYVRQETSWDYKRGTNLALDEAKRLLEELV